uniref:Inositol3 putative n=1 Tax=Albugo laibachii Nc14 TaxID=890382 RepID=F0WAM6_9STRA|nr:inositol3 putative [Albugo laibachii Nc14]|eukprot:CCA18197.1 inositol3 putative [Albugo laibachii Nc14]
MQNKCLQLFTTIAFVAAVKNFVKSEDPNVASVIRAYSPRPMDHVPQGIHTNLYQVTVEPAAPYSVVDVSFSLLTTDILEPGRHHQTTANAGLARIWWMVLSLPSDWHFVTWDHTLAELRVRNPTTGIDVVNFVQINSCQESISDDGCPPMIGMKHSNYGMIKLPEWYYNSGAFGETRGTVATLTVRKSVVSGSGHTASLLHIYLASQQQKLTGNIAQSTIRIHSAVEEVTIKDSGSTQSTRTLLGPSQLIQYRSLASMTVPTMKDEHIHSSLIWIERDWNRLTLSFTTSMILLNGTRDFRVCVNLHSPTCRAMGPASDVSLMFPNTTSATYTRDSNPFLNLFANPTDLNMSVVTLGPEHFCIINLVPTGSVMNKSWEIRHRFNFQIQIHNVVVESKSTETAAPRGRLPSLGLLELRDRSGAIATDCPQVLIHQQIATTRGLSVYSVMSIIMHCVALAGAILITRMNGISFSSQTFFNDMTATCAILIFLLAIINNAIWISSSVGLNSPASHVYFMISQIRECVNWTLLTAVCCHWSEILRADNRTKLPILLIFILVNSIYYGVTLFFIINLTSMFTCTYDDYVDNPLYDKRICGNDHCPDLQPYQWEFAVRQVCRDVPHSKWFFPVVMSQQVLNSMIAFGLLVLGFHVWRRGNRLLHQSGTYANNEHILKAMRRSLIKFVAIIGAVWIASSFGVIIYLYLYISNSYIPPVPWYIFVIWIPVIVPPCALLLLQWNPRLKNLSWKQSMEVTGKRMRTQVTVVDPESELHQETGSCYDSYLAPDGSNVERDDEFKGPEVPNYFAMCTPAPEMHMDKLEGTIGVAVQLTLPASWDKSSHFYIEFYVLGMSNDLIGLSPAAYCHGFNGRSPNVCYGEDEYNYREPSQQSPFHLERSSINALVKTSLQCGAWMGNTTANNRTSMSTGGLTSSGYRLSMLCKPSQWKRLGATEPVQASMDDKKCQLIKYSTILQVSTETSNPILRFVVYAMPHLPVTRVTNEKQNPMSPTDSGQPSPSTSRPKQVCEFTCFSNDLLGSTAFTMVAGNTIPSEVYESNKYLSSSYGGAKAQINPEPLQSPQLHVQVMSVAAKPLSESTDFFISRCFQFGNENEMVIEDMIECVLTNEIPIQVLQILRKDRAEDLMLAQADLEEFKERCQSGLMGGLYDSVIDQIQDENDQSAIQTWLQDRVQKRAAYIELMKRCHQASFDRAREGNYFRPSTERKNALLQFLPVNMHIQDMWVGPTADLRSQHSRRVAESVSCYTTLSVGAFAAHSLGFRHGTGILGLEGKYNKLVSRQPNAFTDTNVRKGSNVTQDIDWRHHEHQQEDDLKWHITTRMDVCLTQAVAALVTTFCRHLEMAIQNRRYNHLLIILERIGFLFQVESLLSTHGKELGMLEDFAAAVDMLKHVTFVLDCSGNSIPSDTASTKITSSSLLNLHMKNSDRPCIVSVRVTGGARTRAYVIYVSLRCNSSVLDVIPSTLRGQKPISVLPICFTQGINEMQTLANNSSGKKTLLQDAINQKSSIELDTFINEYKNLASLQSEPFTANIPSIESVASELRNRILQASKRVVKTKDPEILQLGSRLCRLLGGGRATSCKSAKDRTGMSVTLEQGHILVANHGLPQHKLANAVSTMRSSGVRLENVFKNTHRYLYAFNALQRSMFPEKYRCPEGTYGRGNVTAMDMQAEAERRKRAEILDSEGERQAYINVAEGKKKAAILEAEGGAAAILARAEASAEAINRLSVAIGKRGGSDAVSLQVAEKYVEAFGRVAKESTTLLLPAASSDPATMVASALAIFGNLQNQQQKRTERLKTQTDSKPECNDSGVIDDDYQLDERSNRKITATEDPPIELLEKALKVAKSLLPDPDIFLYTGDSVIHEKSKEVKPGKNEYLPWGNEYVSSVVDRVIKLLYDYYPKTSATEMISTALEIPTNVTRNYEMTITNGMEFNGQISAIANAWKDKFRRERPFHNFQQRGFTKLTIDGKLAVITFNTVAYSPKCTGINAHKTDDPFGQFKWHEAELRDLKEKYKGVFICAIITPYAHIIMAETFGHVHGFETRPLELSDVMVPLHTISAISPKYGNRPTFAVWEYDKITFDATKEYGLRSLAKNDLKLIYNSFDQDAEFLKKYNAYFKNRKIGYTQSGLKKRDCNNAELTNTIPAFEAETKTNEPTTFVLEERKTATSDERSGTERDYSPLSSSNSSLWRKVNDDDIDTLGTDNAYVARIQNLATRTRDFLPSEKSILFEVESIEYSPIADSEESEIDTLVESTA